VESQHAALNNRVQVEVTVEYARHVAEARIVELPFFNLGGTRVKALNGNLSYSVDLTEVLDTSFDMGTLGFRANAYYLMEYTTSGTGNFDDSTPNENTLGNPSWETQFSALYNRGPFSARWTTSYTDDTVVYSGAVPTTLDQATVQRRPAFALHSLSLGYDVTDEASVRVVIDNVTDVTTLGEAGLYNGDYVDTIGRRITGSLTYRF